MVTLETGWEARNRLPFVGPAANLMVELMEVAHRINASTYVALEIRGGGGGHVFSKSAHPHHIFDWRYRTRCGEMYTGCYSLS